MDKKENIQKKIETLHQQQYERHQQLKNWGKEDDKIIEKLLDLSEYRDAECCYNCMYNSDYGDNIPETGYCRLHRVVIINSRVCDCFK